MRSKYKEYTRIARFLLAAGLTIGIAGSLPGTLAARESVFSAVRSISLSDTAMISSSGVSRPEKRLSAKNGRSGGRPDQGWQNAPPEERRRLEQRMKQWNRMPPQEREQYRHRYEQYRRLSPEEQRRLQRDLDRWDQLSPQEREAIRKKFIN